MEQADLKNRLDSYLEKNHLKSTHQRDIITDEFLNTVGKHVTIEEVLELVRKRDSGISYATVYRTLMLFVEAGIANQRHFEGGQSRFELVTEHHHDHLICVECGKIIEFEDDKIEAMQVTIAKKYGFVLTGHKHELYGNCKPCVAKKI